MGRLGWASRRALVLVLAVLLPGSVARAGAAQVAVAGVSVSAPERVAVSCEGVGQVLLEVPHGLRADGSMRVAGSGPVRVAGTGRVVALDRRTGQRLSTGDLSGPGVWCDGIAFSGLRWWQLTPAGTALPAAAEVRRAVAIAWSAHRGQRGDVPGEWARWVEQVLNPTVAWEPVLAAAVRRAVAWGSGLTDRTYSRRSRRQSSVQGVVLAGLRRPVPDVALVIDTFRQRRRRSARQRPGRGRRRPTRTSPGLGAAGSSVRVLSTDAAVHSLQSVRRARDVQLQGGGGTDMRTGIAAAADLRPRCDVCIVLTDGETPGPTMRHPRWRSSSVCWATPVLSCPTHRRGPRGRVRAGTSSLSATQPLSGRFLIILRT